MGKIDELNLALETQGKLIRAGEALLKQDRDYQSELKERIAELEAAESKPKEFVISLHRGGSYVCVTKERAKVLVVGDGSNPEIPVIEKKPLVITKAMAEKMYRDWCFNGIHSCKLPENFVSMFKAAGQDAIAADE